MKFRLRRIVTTVTIVLYLMFFVLYMYSPVNHNEDITKSDPSSTVPNSSSKKEKSAVKLEPSLGVLPVMNLSKLGIAIREMNIAQKILNEKLYGRLQPDDVVIVIQVHKRGYYLKELINSLQKAEDIQKTLLIFSHDYFDEEINNLIKNINFTRVMRIFYPWSIQLHPNTFPGEDPRDCQRNIKRESAIKMKCNNAKYPDLYGHYREARITQTKHHWWWKINRVMDELIMTKDHQGLFLFLEEDHYVAPDFIHMLKLMGRSKLCPSCNILTLGNYAKVLLPHTQSNIAEYVPWVSSKHNMGMAMTRKTWLRIKKCDQVFCYYDDYNWDWTLQHISVKCMSKENRLTAMMLKYPRVFHIGECGIHHKGKDCVHSAAVIKVKKSLESSAKHLFPENLRVIKGPASAFKYKNPKANGGWGDIRDRQMCMEFTRPNISIERLNVTSIIKMEDDSVGNRDS